MQPYKLSIESSAPGGDHRHVRSKQKKNQMMLSALALFSVLKSSLSLMLTLNPMLKRSTRSLNTALPNPSC